MNSILVWQPPIPPPPPPTTKKMQEVRGVCFISGYFYAIHTSHDQCWTAKLPYCTFLHFILRHHTSILIPGLEKQNENIEMIIQHLGSNLTDFIVLSMLYRYNDNEYTDMIPWHWEGIQKLRVYVFTCILLYSARLRFSVCVHEMILIYIYIYIYIYVYV